MNSCKTTVPFAKMRRCYAPNGTMAFKTTRNTNSKHHQSELVSVAQADSKTSRAAPLMLRRLSQTLAGRGASRTWAAAGPSGAGAGGDGLGREAPSVARAGALSPAPSAPRLGLSGQGGLVPGVWRQVYNSDDLPITNSERLSTLAGW